MTAKDELAQHQDWFTFRKNINREKKQTNNNSNTKETSNRLTEVAMPGKTPAMSCEQSPNHPFRRYFRISEIQFGCFVGSTRFTKATLPVPREEKRFLLGSLSSLRRIPSCFPRRIGSPRTTQARERSRPLCVTQEGGKMKNTKCI